MGAAGIGMLFTGVSAGLQVYSQLQAGKTAERVAKANDKNAQQEATNREAEATNKELEFAESVKRSRMNQRKAAATLRARLSTQGTRTDTGTALDIMGETDSAFELAVNDAARQVGMQSASIYQNAAMVRYQGKMGVYDAQQAKKASTLSAIGTGISAVSGMVSTYAHNRYTGALKS